MKDKHLIQLAWAQGKLRYQDRRPDLTRGGSFDLSRTKMTGVEFLWSAEKQEITGASRTVDGEELTVDEFRQELREAVGLGREVAVKANRLEYGDVVVGVGRVSSRPFIDDTGKVVVEYDHQVRVAHEPAAVFQVVKGDKLKQFIVTQKTSVMAFGQQDAIDRVNNQRKGDSYPEVIEQIAEPFEELVDKAVEELEDETVPVAAEALDDDAATCDRIWRILNGTEWSTDTIEEVAEVLKQEGYEIEPPTVELEEVPERGRPVIVFGPAVENDTIEAVLQRVGGWTVTVISEDYGPHTGKLVEVTTTNIAVDAEDGRGACGFEWTDVDQVVIH
jgi:hypothetical protein